MDASGSYVVPVLVALIAVLTAVGIVRGCLLLSRRRDCRETVMEAQRVCREAARAREL